MMARPIDERTENLSADQQGIILIRDKVRQFLRDNGGKENGEMTWVNGSIGLGRCVFAGYDLDWMTPLAFKELTAEQIFKKGYELQKEIVMIMKEHGIRAVEIKKYEGDRHFFSTYVRIPLQVQAW